ncbi:MAG: NmrA family transcriptional regulator [Winogradskyella sp.]|uniref:NmrA family NAD(P)-binding protein n=1 Tax=Winogradskyella sp. TaxID=1883156 RepID=UPI000F3F3462|nr:NAD(P)H-binding protein [Winogradskyella sp.]RNC85003.1 MAG: NmrA family transcriptional regulator [Winogradskyella sp.]
MRKEHFLITGGTGKTGRRIVDRLQKLGHKVRIGSRSAKPAFDWNQPENWNQVLDGIDKVYITYQPDLAVPGAKEAITELVKQAKKSKVKKLVLLSGKGEKEAQLCEKIVINSGIDYTIVRASWFNQNFSENFLLEPILDGVVALPQSKVKIPFVDANDIADVVVEVFLNDKHNGQIYELTGEQLFTFKEVIDIISKVSNQSITFIPVTLEEYSNAMREMQLPEDFIWLIDYLFDVVLGNPENSIVTNDIELVLGKAPISFSEYAEKVAQTGIWNQTKVKA